MPLDSPSITCQVFINTALDYTWPLLPPEMLEMLAYV